MASAKNEAPKAPREVEYGEGVSPSPPKKGSGLCSSAELNFVFDFWAQNGKFWCVLGANFIAFELSYTHKPVSLEFGL